MILQLFIIGLVVGFIFYEITGISPGGVIAPAYFALFIYEPDRIIMTIIIALIVYVIIRLLSAYLILYGRRKFLLAVVLSFFLKLLIDSVVQPIDFMKIDLQSIGYIIPGLIANEMGRQKITSTLLSLGIVTMIIFQISLFIS
ncbi:MAG TPA: poly-gamma-glutamate biosynthesis protein PgsC [Bacteroidales bacterium]|nr:poly-gamma-glutamate biosynthesis protein PgsC [Bacteroidales bacterium]